MVKTKTELINDITAILGDNKSDEAISLLENVSDTLDSTANKDYDELKAKYDEEVQKNADLDKSWREKYISRFNSTQDDSVIDNSTKKGDNGSVDNTTGTDEKLTFESLFKNE